MTPSSVSNTPDVPTDHRTHKVLSLIKKRGRVTVKELSKVFRVSEVTIRTDLNELAQQGLIVRTFGGAVDIPYPMREAQREEQPPPKSRTYRLARAAAELVTPGDVIFLDSSDEVREMLPYVKDKKSVKVFTNSLDLAYKLSVTTKIAVVVLGGQVRPDTLAITADNLDPVLGTSHITKAFFGAWGFSKAEGLTDINTEDARLKREVARRSRVNIAIVSSDRWQRVSSDSFAGPDQISILITDSSAPHDLLAFCTQESVQVIQESIDPDKDRDRYAAFNMYREYAMRQEPYPGQPGRAKRLAFGNGCRTQSFGSLLEQGMLSHAGLAGFDPSDVIVVDNQFDSDRGLHNAEQILAESPDVFVEFQVDEKTNNIIAAKFEQAGIPVIAVEIPFPSAPFVGLNNWKVAVMAGEYAARLIRERWGDSEDVDLVVLMQMPVYGDLNMLRTEGFAAALIDEFGDETEDKIVRADGGMGQPVESETAMDDVLSRFPDARRIVITSINEETMEGIIISLKKNDRWDSENLVLVTHGCDTLGQKQIRQGFINGTIASFPERYGEYVLPAVCAVLRGEVVPPYTYVDNVLITADNIDRYYPSGEMGTTDEFELRRK